MLLSAQIQTVNVTNGRIEGVPVWPTYDQKNKRAMIFTNASSTHLLPNVEKYKAFDTYHAWRRQQAKERK